MLGKTILILGGGIGGMVAASELRRLLPAEHRVVLVEKNPKHAFPPSFLWLMTGDRQPEQIMRDMRGLVRPGVEVILAEARLEQHRSTSIHARASPHAGGGSRLGRCGKTNVGGSKRCFSSTAQFDSGGFNRP